jgi:hypothetical protein
MFNNQKKSHPFSEAYDCTAVEVQPAPLSPENPTGYVWERPCKCPLWTALQQTRIVGAQDGGVPVTEVVTIQGCLNRLLPYMATSAMQQASAGLHETVKTRKIIETEDPLREVVRALIGAVEQPLKVLGGGPNT